MSKTALITGGNSGIGYSIAERLLSNDSRTSICLGCRNEERAKKACSTLQASFPTSIIDYVIVDVSKIYSVLECAANLKARYSHLDLIYLNAGILPVSRVDWSYFFKNLFTKEFVNMFTTGNGLLLQNNATTVDGYKEIFATNVFGHFILIKELSYIIGGEQDTKVIWTSSSNAMQSNFDIQDIQHENGRDPYSSSKYLMDMLSVVFNEKFNKNNVFCYSTCPGLVITNLSLGICPSWFWNLFMPILYIMRIVVPSMTYTPYNGSEAAIWLSEADPRSLKSENKYFSNVSVFNNRSVKQKNMNICIEKSIAVFNLLSSMEDVAKRNVSNKTS